MVLSGSANVGNVVPTRPERARAVFLRTLGVEAQLHLTVVATVPPPSPTFFPRNHLTS